MRNGSSSESSHIQIRSNQTAAWNRNERIQANRKVEGSNTSNREGKGENVRWQKQADTEK